VQNRLFFSILILTLACTGRALLPGFDRALWQADTEGCQGQRQLLAEELVRRKAELSGHGQHDITALLGKPDRHELYSRNKKAFVYFIAGGPACNRLKENPARLVIRFDGIGRAKEIILYDANQ